MSKNIGIIGLGRCGMPAAKKFIENGYQVVGHARRPEVIEALKKMGGIHAASPMEVASQADTVIVIVLNDEQVFEVVTGPKGVLQTAKPGSLLICMSTINRANLRLMASPRPVPPYFLVVEASA